MGFMSLPYPGYPPAKNLENDTVNSLIRPNLNYCDVDKV